MRVLIADDEPLARRRLLRLLARMPDVEVVGEAASGAEAEQLAQCVAPELALLDIDMPGLDGLTLARALGSSVSVVFTTAHAKHAVDAFALAAVDYLLKPIEETRLAQALDRVRRARATAATDPAALERTLRALLATSTPARPQRLAARAGDAIELIDPTSLTRLYASDKYTLCRVDTRELVLDESLSVLEERLAPLGFFRVHRSELVNLHRVRALHTELDGTFVLLDDGQRAPVSRRALSELKQRLGIA